MREIRLPYIICRKEFGILFNSVQVNSVMWFYKCHMALGLLQVHLELEVESRALLVLLHQGVQTAGQVDR